MTQPSKEDIRLLPFYKSANKEQARIIAELKAEIKQLNLKRILAKPKGTQTMKLSELEARLYNLRQSNGDLEVYTEECDDRGILQVLLSIDTVRVKEKADYPPQKKTPFKFVVIG